MKKSIRILALSLAAATVAFPAPFLAVGDGAELFLTGTLGVRSDDNVFLSNNKVDDVIIDINPGVELTFGKGARTQGSFSFTEKIARYSQNGGLDTELASLAFSSQYDDGKSKFSTSASYNELNQNTIDTTGNGNVLARRDVVNLGANAELSASAKSKVGIGIKYVDTDYARASFNDQTVFEIPVNYYYAVTSKVDLSAGYRYRNTEIARVPDSKGHSFRIGARGEFSPKTTGSVAVGFGSRNFSGNTISDKDLLDLDAKLNIALSAKSTLSLTASNDFGVSGTGREQKNLSLGGTLIGKVSDQLSLRGGLTFRNIDYYTAEDNYTEFRLGLDYVVSTMVTIQGGYIYRNNDSAAAGGDFDNSVFSLAGKFRY
jgi:hypothetical protein